MAKDTTYSLRINSKLKEALAVVAKKDRRTISSLLEKNRGLFRKSWNRMGRGGEKKERKEKLVDSLPVKVFTIPVCNNKSLNL